MQQPEHQLHFSVLSLWEIMIKRGLGRFRVDSSLLYRGLIEVTGYLNIPRIGLITTHSIPFRDVSHLANRPY